MATDSAEDLNIFQSLWENINDLCAPPPPPGEPAKACFLMELPGFSISPDAFDVTKFSEDSLSPDHSTAVLCDRIPALARYFYDTGYKISKYWETLMEYFRIQPDPAEGRDHLLQSYNKAIKMLYGSTDNYVNGVKTKFYSLVDTLRTEYEAAVKEDTDFRHECQQDKDKWPMNYQTGVGPIKDKVNSAYSRYNTQRLQVRRYEAAIYAYAAGDLSSLMLQASDSMGLQKRYGAGADRSAYYPVVVQPADWWKWFRTGEDKPGDDGWTEVTITQTHRYESSHDTYSKVSAEAGASYGGLFYHGGGSGGFDKSSGNHSLTKAGSNFSLTFKIRKVNINRSWMDPSILLYSTLGVKGVTVGSWSSGQLSATKNHGTFPIFPTAMVVAKDVSLKADSYTDYAATAFKEMSTNAAFKVGIGPFSANGNFSSASGSTDTTSKYDAATKTLTVNGAQIIGWVCTVNPDFPQYSAEYKQNPKDPKSPAYVNPNVIMSDYSVPTTSSARSYDAPAYGAPPYTDPAQFAMPRMPQFDPRSFMGF